MKYIEGKNRTQGILFPGDSTKIRAQNSKKNNFNACKIERHLAYIDNKLNEYNKALEVASTTAMPANLFGQNNQKETPSAEFSMDSSQNMDKKRNNS